MPRTIFVKKRIISYDTVEVNLVDHLVNNYCELYLNRELQCVEIRLPTRVEGYSHYYAHIPLNEQVDISLIKDHINRNDIRTLLAIYEDIIEVSSNAGEVVYKDLP